MRNYRKQWGVLNQVSPTVLKNHNAADLYIRSCKAAARVAAVSFCFCSFL